MSTLQFAQRAKLIKNKVFHHSFSHNSTDLSVVLLKRFRDSCFLQAVINEDTQGNVKQLQAEVKKLKEQLAQALTSSAGDYAPRGPQPFMGKNTQINRILPSRNFTSNNFKVNTQKYEIRA